MNNTKEVDRQTINENSQPHCPECGELMLSVDNCQEGSICYVWYECPRQDCAGQWLQRNDKVLD